MARRSAIRLALALVVLNAAILACAYAANPTIDVGAVVSQTLAAAATQAAAMVQPTAAPAVVTPEVVTPEASPTVPIVHQFTPGSPGLAARFITDRSSSALAGENRTIADDFNDGFLERPLTLPGMEYQPYLDLTRGEISAGGGWIYIVLFLEGAPPSGQPATYGAELDLDLDGRGDWWIAGSAPQNTTWTTDGVRALRDSNHDVGGPNPMKSDGPPPTGDGYETLVFDSGRGDDPDAAWIRLSPTNPKNIELAVKLTLISGDNEFLWGIWADASPHPEWFDYNDHFTIEQAGSPLIESSNYPLKDLSAVDSSCRWGYDFNPVGNEPGVCRIPPTPTSTPSKTPTLVPTLILR